MLRDGSAAAADDDSLADLIDADGRARLSARLPIALERYTESVPGIAQRPVVLDAAIDFALRGAIAGGRSESDAAAALKARYPAWSTQIDAARELSRALLATGGAAALLDGAEGSARTPELALPCDVGPLSMMGKARYRLVRQLGRGSHGTAYLAEDRQLSSAGQPPALVCVKMLAIDPSHEARALSEASRARRINHPAVVRVLDRGAHQGREYIVYEFIEGRALDAHLSRLGRPIKPREAAALMIQITRGVQAAHSAGLIHRDLKPDNILITPTGEPKITDFGAAAIVELDGSSPDSPALALGRSGTPAPIGNLAFMAPEQFWMSRGAISPAADLYALGGLLYFLLTGSLPNGSTAEEIRDRHSGVAPRPMSDGAVNARSGRRLDPDLLAICRRALDPRAEARQTSADALAADLEQWLDCRPIAWTKPTPARRAWLALKRQPLLYALLLALLVIVAISVRLVVIERAVSATESDNSAAVLSARATAPSSGSPRRSRRSRTPPPPAAPHRPRRAE
ncbi:MAG: serine/threonine-protein kinase [Phycisphaerales bacterium]